MLIKMQILRHPPARQQTGQGHLPLFAGQLVSLLLSSTKLLAVQVLAELASGKNCEVQILAVPDSLAARVQVRAGLGGAGAR